MQWKVLGALILTAALPAQSGDMPASFCKTCFQSAATDPTFLPKAASPAQAVALIRPAEQISTNVASLDCGDAYDEADIASEDLAISAERLRRCAEDMDVASDGCTQELDRVRSDQSEFKRSMTAVIKKCER